MRQKQLTPKHLYWLLFSLASVLAMHIANLPLWVTVTCSCFGIWRYLLDKKHWGLPKIRVLAPVTVVICLAVLFNFASSFGRDASISLLVLMCAMKLLEAKTVRDYMLIIAIAYFILGSAFIFNQGVSTFLPSLIPLTLLTATLIQASLPETANMNFVLKLAGKMLLQATPLMLVLFILFPRLPGPIWGMSKDAYSSMTGLDDQLELGDVGQLTKNSSVAFRVQFAGNIPPQNQLYWRGPVLWHHNKNKWVANNQGNLPQESLTTLGSTIDYTITLEPHNRLWLLMLDMPTRLPNIATLKHDYTAVARSPIRSRTRYQVTSHNQYNLGKKLGEKEQQIALTFNPDENPKTITLGQSWAHLTPKQKVNKALQLFNQQPFIYTLRPPPLYEHAIDDFLFKTQKGFCGHYASSFVYLMRSAGLPARIVTGYQGGELNPNGNYLIVRQSDAHAWAEVWLEEKGWVRIDPTAAVSPDRIEKGIEEAIAELDALPMMVRGDFPWLKSAYLNWDNINNNWNQWILGYDTEKQLDFLKQLSGKALTFNDIAIAMIAAILAAIIMTAGFILKKQVQKISPVESLYAQYIKKLKTIGIQPRVGEGAINLAHRAAKASPAHTTLIMEIAILYNQLTFSQPEKPEQALQLLTQYIHTFKNIKP